MFSLEKYFYQQFKEKYDFLELNLRFNIMFYYNHCIILLYKTTLKRFIGTT